MNHIREKLPGLKRKIEELTAETQAKYSSFGGMAGDESRNRVSATSQSKKLLTKRKKTKQTKQAPTLLRLLNQYAANFVDSVDGNSGEISLQEL